MSITLLQSGADSPKTATQSVPKAGLANGDRAKLIIIGSRQATGYTLPAGFTVEHDNRGDSIGDQNIIVADKLITDFDNEPTNYDVTYEQGYAETSFKVFLAKANGALTHASPVGVDGQIPWVDGGTPNALLTPPQLSAVPANSDILLLISVITSDGANATVAGTTKLFGGDTTSAGTLEVCGYAGFTTAIGGTDADTALADVLWPDVVNDDATVSVLAFAPPAPVNPVVREALFDASSGSNAALTENALVNAYLMNSGGTALVLAQAQYAINASGEIEIDDDALSSTGTNLTLVWNVNGTDVWGATPVTTINGNA